MHLGLVDQPNLTTLVRTSGIGRRALTLTAVERRRIEVACITLLFVVATAIAGTTASHWTATPRDAGVDWLSTTNGRLVLFAIAVGFGAYVVQTELALHRLTNLLVEERARSAALQAEAADLAALVAAAEAATGSHQLQEALTGVLDQAVHLAGADRGAIFLVADGTDDLVANASVGGGDSYFGGTARRGVGPIGWVALRGEPTAFGANASAEAIAYAVPLSWRGQVCGVLALASDDAVDTRSQRLVEAFAPHAAAAIANARLHDFERERWLRSARSEVAQDSFLTALSHELRTPLTALFGAIRTLERAEVSSAHRTELVGMLDRQARRLMTMIDGLISVAIREREAAGDLGIVDVRMVVEAAVKHQSMVDRTVQLDVDDNVPDGAGVIGRADDMRAVLGILLDNAFVHGSSPVAVSVRRERDWVRIDVRDHGPGIPVDQRADVLVRFERLDFAHSTPGLGLGLSTAVQLVEKGGGRLTIDSPSDGGAGTVVTVHLRAAPE